MQNNTNNTTAATNPFAGLIAAGLGTEISFAAMLIRTHRTQQAREIFGEEVAQEALRQIAAESKASRTPTPKPVAHQQMEQVLHAGAQAMAAAYSKLTQGDPCTTTEDGAWPAELGAWLATIPNRSNTAIKTMHTTGVHGQVGTCLGSSVDLVIRGNHWRHKVTKAQQAIKAGQEAWKAGDYEAGHAHGLIALELAKEGQSAKQQQAAQNLITACADHLPG